MKLELAYEVSNDFLDNVITSATESGVHGATYWMHVTRVLNDGLWIRYDRKIGGEGNRNGKMTLRRADVLLGIQRLLQNRNIDVAVEYLGRLSLAVLRDDSGEVDGPLADLIFQAAVFNEIVYG